MALTAFDPTPQSDLQLDIENRAARQLLGICARKGCGLVAVDGSDYCAPHRDAQHEYDRRHKRTKYRANAAKGLCPKCGKRKPAKKSKWCSICKVLLGRVSRPDLQSYIENKKERVAARMIPWDGSPTNKNRVRMRGGKQGRRSKAIDDAQDLGDATKGLRLADEGLQHSRTPEVQEMPRIQRLEVRSAALNHAYRAVRLVLSVLVRHGEDVSQIVAGLGDEDT